MHRLTIKRLNKSGNVVHKINPYQLQLIEYTPDNPPIQNKDLVTSCERMSVAVLLEPLQFSLQRRRNSDACRSFVQTVDKFSPVRKVDRVAVSDIDRFPKSGQFEQSIFRL
jgi:hypothetical protein